MRTHLLAGGAISQAIPARLFGAPVERKRFLKSVLGAPPLRPVLRFVYMYGCGQAFLDGRAGFIYCVFKAIQEFHISCKMYEDRLANGLAPMPRQPAPSSPTPSQPTEPEPTEPQPIASCVEKHRKRHRACHSIGSFVTGIGRDTSPAGDHMYPVAGSRSSAFVHRVQ